MSNDGDNQTGVSGYQAFRHRLDVVLRQRDPAALRAFLVAEGQWESDAQTDVDVAMWMMIATSKALAHLHDEARSWLLAHGHAAEVNAIFGERPRPNAPGRPPARRGPPPSGNRRADAPRGGQYGSRGRGSDRHGNDRRPRG